MNNPNELTEALAQNGGYDPAKADELRAKVVGTFQKAMRKTERYFWGYVCLLASLAVFAGAHFMNSSSTKALLFYGLLTLVFMEHVVLMKLWYIAAINKISVLKAIKQLELGGAAGGDAAMPPKHEAEYAPLEGLPRWERRLWKIAVFACCFLVLFVKGFDVQGVDDPWDITPEGSFASNGYVTLVADGSGAEVTDVSFLHAGTLVRRGFDYTAADGAEVQFHDVYGNELSAQKSSELGRVRYDVHLPRPIMPGRRFSYTRTEKHAELAAEEEGVWTYSADDSAGFETNEFSLTVELPEGAEIVSAEPSPIAQFTFAGKPTIRFQATRGKDEPFKYAVQYRLPEEAAEQ